MGIEWNINSAMETKSPMYSVFRAVGSSPINNYIDTALKYQFIIFRTISEYYYYTGGLHLPPFDPFFFIKLIKKKTN
jgi:hypothetical protein